MDRRSLSKFCGIESSEPRIYRVILELLWPEGHGIPGPFVGEEDIRNAINVYRKNQGKEPYHDPFRRVRELQGEEGVIGIIKNGRIYQLAHLRLANKREPRRGLNEEDWDNILERYKRKCAVCARAEGELRFDRDHKIPRLRGGRDSIDNWQPLCKECNNFKSTACRGCDRDCHTCSWAFPEKYVPLHLSLENTYKIRRLASNRQEDPNDLLNQIVENYEEP